MVWSMGENVPPPQMKEEEPRPQGRGPYTDWGGTWTCGGASPVGGSGVCASWPPPATFQLLKRWGRGQTPCLIGKGGA